MTERVASHGQHGHGHQDHGHRGGHVAAAGADRRWLAAALALIGTFMLAEVVVGVLANSVALISDAGHMLTDAGAIVLALVAIRLAARPARGAYTYGLKRAEILSAQANGITLLLLAAWFVYLCVVRLIDPPEVAGLAVLITGLVGIPVNLAATWLISKANRTSLNVEGAFQHILNDLFAFIATAAAGLVMVLTGFARADAIAALVVAALMTVAGVRLVRDSGRVFLEAAPPGIDPDQVEAELRDMDGVVDVHELHIWQVTSGFPALSAHVLVTSETDCHDGRWAIERLLAQRYALEHTTLQVDHRDEVHTLQSPPPKGPGRGPARPGPDAAEPGGQGPAE